MLVVGGKGLVVEENESVYQHTERFHQVAGKVEKIVLVFVRNT